MISIRKIEALFVKDMKSVFYNLFIIVGLLLMPAIAFVNIQVNDYIDKGIIHMLLQMNILFNAATIICVMIAEEKEKQTLNVLSAATVSGLDFLISKLAVTIVLVSAVNIILYYILGLQDMFEMRPFILLTIAVLMPAATIGGIVGIACKTQSAASAAVSPLALVFIFLPAIITDGFFAENIMGFLFTEQFYYGLQAIYTGESLLPPLRIIGMNFLIPFIIFCLYYKKKGLTG